MLLCLNQDSMDRHLRLMGTGGRVVYNSDLVKPGEAREGVQLCPIPVAEVTKSRNKLAQNTVAVGAVAALLGLDFQILQDSLTLRFQRQGQRVVDENVGVAQAGYNFVRANYEPFPVPVPSGHKPLAVWSGNDALAMGGAAAGMKFYVAYPMSPSSGVLHWIAQNAQSLGIMVRQVEDELAVANMAIGAAQAGCRTMCATSGGGFSLMTEAVGSASMMEIPVIFINVQRGGPSTGLPTKTEQADLWQALGASQGDFERFIVAPMDALDSYNTVIELFNLTDKFQCPGIIISDLLLAEGRFSVDADDVDLRPKIDRGELITEPSAPNGYLRYKITESGISPRALPGLEGHTYIAATDEHDEDSTQLSDEFTDARKRRKMLEKRARKFGNAVDSIEPPRLLGPEDAEVTLIGWGSTYGVIQDAVEQLKARGVTVNHLPIKWMVPFHGDAVTSILSCAKRTIIVENNFSGQFFRYLRGETGFTVDGNIRKYDGEPFMPHHIVDGVLEQLAGKTDHYVPYHEVRT
jgi:2-oxoglutarate ferredoxin oxidoreductase subunit alpha